MEMGGKMATLLLLLAALALLLPSSCIGTKHQVISEPSWGLIVDDPVTGKQNHFAFQPNEIPLPDGATGAESVAFDRRGNGPYTGVSDGRVVKWDGRAGVWTTFTYSPNYNKFPQCNKTSGDRWATGNETVCGRPLGLQFFGKTGELYIADAYLGLMKVGPQGGEAEVLATAADDGVPFTFINGLDVDQATGDVYFSDSSRVFQRRHNVQIMYNRDATGRLLKYDARTKRVAVLKADLPYPNGVAVSGDRTHVVVAHTWPSKVFRYWIAGAKAGQYELFADVPGYPDNIRRDGTGGFWVALNREKIIFTAAGAPAPAPASSVPRPHLVGVRIDGRGKEQQLLTAPRGVTLSDVAEKDGKQLWLGSVELGYVSVVDYIMIR